MSSEIWKVNDETENVTDFFTPGNRKNMEYCFSSREYFLSMYQYFTTIQLESKFTLTY